MQIGDHATELAEVLAEVLDRIAVVDEENAHLRERVEHLEQRASANRALICECERFIKAQGALWTTMAAEAERISSAQQAPD